MSFFAAILALIDELVKGLNLFQASQERANDRKAGADALAASQAATTAEVSDAQEKNDLAPRDIDSIARELRDSAAAGAGSGRALRPGNAVDSRAKA
jgi:hypothetical protein